MSTESNSNSSKSGILTTTQGPFVSTFIAVVVGASLIEFNELLFPPDLTSLNFWAIFAVYYTAFSLWFGIITMSRARPYKDTFISRIWLLCGVLSMITLLGLMYFATRITDFLAWYMWGWVITFFFFGMSYVLRYIDLRLPEPIGLCGIFGLLALIAAIAYSIWTLIFPPVPTVVNWVFVFIAFAIIVSFRQLLRVTHFWQPVPSMQQ